MPDVDDELIWKGAWAAAESYAELDVVTLGLRAYVCTDAHTSDQGNTPPNAFFWEILVEESVGDAYLTVAEYRSRIDGTDPANDTVIAEDLAGISNLIAKDLGQSFGRDASPVSRLFRAKYSDVLDLTYEGNCPGIATLTGLVVKVDTDGDRDFADETALTINTHFELLPLQANQGQEPRPWDRIRILRGSARSFVVGELVQVTAEFGWPTVPEMIKALTAKWAEVWRIDGPAGTGQVSEMGSVFSVSRDVKVLADRVRLAYAARVTF